jgi:hypothetical protein
MPWRDFKKSMTSVDSIRAGYSPRARISVVAIGTDEIAAGGEQDAADSAGKINKGVFLEAG